VIIVIKAAYILKSIMVSAMSLAIHIHATMMEMIAFAVKGALN
jgi:hypothetical protein